MAKPPSSSGKSDFGDLRRLIMENGLMRRQPVRSVTKLALFMGALTVCIMFLFLTENLWLHLLNALFMTVIFAQISLIGHDAGHRQITSSKRWGDFFAYLAGGLVGISPMSWTTRHNEHHASPNRQDVDPDIHFPFLAYSEKQAEAKTHPVHRFIVRHQSLLYFPILTLTGLSLRNSDLRFMYRHALKQTWLDIFLFGLHHLAYAAILFAAMSPLHVGLFALTHYVAWGLYMGMIFAPNHKGMEMLDSDTEMDFLREQVLTARNVRGGFLVNFWYGGLNYQIEHHLFPTMPRSNLPKAQKIVREFCRERGIPYHQTGVLQSYKEIIQYMHLIGASLRGRVKA